MMNRFENKVCLITGAASGIGMATALAFAKEGAKVVISDVAEETGRKVEDEIQKFNDRSFFVHCDIAVKEDVQNLITVIADTFGRMDCAVNCAGIAGKHTA